MRTPALNSDSSIRYDKVQEICALLDGDLMLRFFNTAGPCEPQRHYMLPPLSRLEGIHILIERAYYFVLHAPRQTGKTTALLALARELTDVPAVNFGRRGERTLGQGVSQLSSYLERLRLDHGYLILFDRRKTVSWDEKLYEKEVEGAGGRRILVFGM